MSTLRRKFPCVFTFLLALAAALTLAHPTPAQAVGFQPVSPDELKMVSEAKAPGAAAIILYRQVDRDDRGQTAREDVSFA